MHSIHQADDSGQDIDVAASVAVEEAGIVAVDETRQYRPRCLNDLYPDLEPVERELQVRHFVERHWSKVGRRDSHECWPWLGTIADSGYGLLSYRHNRNLYAHCLAFIFEHGEIPEGVEVLHDCGNKRCTNPRHLKAGGDSENMLDAIRHGTHAYRVKLSATEAYEIRELYFAGGITYRQLAEDFGVSLTTIGNVINRLCAHTSAKAGVYTGAKLTASQVTEARQRVGAGESCEVMAAEFGVQPVVLRKAVYGHTWQEVPGSLEPPGTPRGERNGASKLTEKEVLDILQRVAAGESQGAMARKYGLSRSTVSRIVNGERWAHLREGSRF
jgi:Mor family transcriptional regulator